MTLVLAKCPIAQEFLDEKTKVHRIEKSAQEKESLASKPPSTQRKMAR